MTALPVALVAAGSRAVRQQGRLGDTCGALAVVYWQGMLCRTLAQKHFRVGGACMQIAVGRSGPLQLLSAPLPLIVGWGSGSSRSRSGSSSSSGSSSLEELPT